MEDLLKDFTCFDSDVGSIGHKVISQMLLLSLEPHSFHAKKLATSLLEMKQMEINSNQLIQMYEAVREGLAKS